MRMFKGYFNRRGSCAVLVLLLVFAFSQTTAVFAATLQYRIVNSVFDDFDDKPDTFNLTWANNTDIGTPTLTSGKIRLTNISDAHKNYAAIVNKTFLISRRGDTTARVQFKFDYSLTTTPGLYDFQIKKNNTSPARVAIGHTGNGQDAVYIDFNEQQKAVVSYFNALPATGTYTGANLDSLGGAIQSAASTKSYPLNEFFHVTVLINHVVNGTQPAKTFSAWVDGEQIVDGKYILSSIGQCGALALSANGVQDVYIDDIFMRASDSFGDSSSVDVGNPAKINAVKRLLTYNKLSKEHQNRITSDLNLPTVFSDDYNWLASGYPTIAWSAVSGTSIDPETGEVTRPAAGQPDETVTLRATLSTGVAHPATATKDFTFKVLAQDNDPLYRLGAITLYDNAGTVIGNPAEDTSGTVKLRSNTEFLANGSEGIKMIAALYDDHDSLLHVGVPCFASDLFTIGLSLPNTELNGAKIKVFAWNLDTLMPYAVWASEE